MLAAQGGANLIYGAGMLEFGMTFDFAQLLMDSEIFKMILRAVSGIVVNDANMALDVIKDVGTGEFVSHEHTFKNFKQNQVQTKLINRQSREAWLADGEKSFTERAYEAAINIIENHKPDPLEPAAKEAIRSIVENAEKEYGVLSESC